MTLVTVSLRRNYRPTIGVGNLGSKGGIVSIVKRQSLIPEWFLRPDFADLLGWPTPNEWQTQMRVEDFREGNEYVVRAEMAGIDPDKDVEITVKDRVLRIQAERRSETKTEEKGGYRSEFQYGSFSRSVPLPVGATEDDVKANYRDGILEVRVPIDTGKAEATKVPVQRT